MIHWLGELWDREAQERVGREMEAEALCRDCGATVPGLARQSNGEYRTLEFCKDLDTAIRVGYRQGSYFWGGLESRWCHGHLLGGRTEAMHHLALVYKEGPQDFCFAIFVVLTLRDPKYISM